jgi:hypothetical protein
MQTKISIFDPVEKTEVHTLPNGMRIAIYHDKTVNFAHLNLVIFAGSYHDEPSKVGTAHFLEHVLFQSHPFVSPKKIDNFFSENYALWGNGMTSLYHSNYFCKAHATNLEKPLGYLLNLAFKPEWNGFRKEKKIIEQEMLDGRPKEILAMEKEHRSFLMKGQPYGYPYDHRPLGYPETFSKITKNDLIHFHQRYYNPSNAILIIVGNATIESVSSVLPEWFSSLDRKPIISHLKDPNCFEKTSLDYCLPISELNLPKNNYLRFDQQIIYKSDWKKIFIDVVSEKIYKILRGKRKQIYSMGKETEHLGKLRINTLTIQSTKLEHHMLSPFVDSMWNLNRQDIKIIDSVKRELEIRYALAQYSLADIEDQLLGYFCKHGDVDIAKNNQEYLEKVIGASFVEIKDYLIAIKNSNPMINFSVDTRK